MRAFWEILLALLAVWGLISLGWLLFGRLLTPVDGGEVRAVVLGTGSGSTLEQTVNSLLWLRSSGLWQGTILIADCGLDGAGRAAAGRLARREPGVELSTPEELVRYIQKGGR